MAVTPPTPVNVEVARVDANLFPVNFPFPLIDSFVRQNDDLKLTADQSNGAANSAYEATVKNEAQDARLDSIDSSLSSIDTRVTQNESDIAQNTIGISQNASSIAANTGNISSNTADISTNASGISTNAANLSAHTGSSSEHGVNGDNVGTGDYAQAAVGGVVNLAAEIDELTYSAVSVGAAPAAYDQAYAQSLADAINAMAGQVSDLYDKINEIIQGQKSAKQMDIGAP